MPRSGQFPVPPMPNAAMVMGVQGPLARSAEDLELALDVAAGAGGRRGRRLAAGAAAGAPRAAGRRSAWRCCRAIAWLPVDAEIAAALDAPGPRLGAPARGSSRAAGGARRPSRRTTRSTSRSLAASPSARGTGRAAPRAARRSAHARRRVEPAPSSAGSRAARPTTSRWLGQREQYRAAWRAFFREWDVLLAPAFFDAGLSARRQAVAGTPASLRQDARRQRRPVPKSSALVYPRSPRCAGQPATAFPVGLTRAGLPIGLQAIGPYLEDRTPIRFAALVAREFGGFTPPPRLRRGLTRGSMKISAFHLMPHRELPDDFEKRYPSVWVTPPWHELADPARVGQYYNWTLDELLYAARAGFDGVCTNEHHQNAYGFMPSPNLMGSVLARGTAGIERRDRADGRDAADLEPADPRRGRVRDARLHQRRAARGGPAARQPHGRELLLRHHAHGAPRALPRGLRAHAEGVAGEGDLRVERALLPARQREPVAAAGAAAAPAGLDPGLGQHQHVRLRRRQRGLLLLPQLLGREARRSR